MYSDTLNLDGLPSSGRFSGLPAAEIEAFEKRSGLHLPDLAKAFYALSDGINLPHGKQLLTLAKAEEYATALRDFGISQGWGYLPFTENNDSNPYCLCCSSPIASYIVKVSHDDLPEIKFRSLNHFLAALAELVRQDEWDLWDLPSDFSGTHRTSEDIHAGRTLLRIAPGLDDIEQRDAVGFALTLLSEQEVNEVIPLLQHQNEEVREAVLQRLSAMQSPIAREAIKQHWHDFETFVKTCGELLVTDGIRATVVDGRKIRLDPGPTWLNMEIFYSRRDEPDLAAFLVQRARFILSRK